MEYEAVIGLETHVQLKTKSKMWCGCANAFGAEPNTNVCPVCLGLPGVLPVPNEEALRLTVLTGLLLNCAIPPFAKFDRKSYFTSRRTWARARILSGTAGWISTAPACRCWKSFPSRT